MVVHMFGSACEDDNFQLGTSSMNSKLTGQGGDDDDDDDAVNKQSAQR